MIDDRSLERAARSWLEAGPTEAPERAVEAALLRIASTTQERDLRIPWGVPALNTLTRIAATVAIGVLFVGGAFLYLGRPSQPGPVVGPPVTPSPSAPAATSSPSGTTTQTAAPSSAASSPSASGLPAFAKTFTSPKMGFSVSYPDRWSVHPATESWTAGETISWGGGTNDDLHGADVRLSVASQPLKAGDTPTKRLQAMVDASPVCRAVVPAPTTVTVGGETGTVAVNGCVNLGSGGMIPGGRAYVVLLVVGSRAYDFILDGAVDPAYLEAILATVKFDPASAVD